MKALRQQTHSIESYPWRDAALTQTTVCDRVGRRGRLGGSSLKAMSVGEAFSKGGIALQVLCS